jgi:selenocysteine lyase/cysteine desulfurase
MSPLPKASLMEGERGLRRKSQPWTIAPADFFTSSEAVRKLFADLINADVDDIAFVPAVSYGMAQAAHNIPIEKTQTIVTLSEQFPSNVYPWMDLAERTGAAFVPVPRPGDDDWTSALLAFIDRSIGIVAVPHCHWTDGGLIDLEAIGAACRRVGAALCVDATQSVGALPLDVKRVDPDFVAVASYKWLLGPYSLGFLYVAPRWQDGRPIEHNWIARKDSEDFAGLVNYSGEFQAGARRFDVGERSNFALMPVAEASLKLLSEWTVPRIFETLRLRTAAIAERAHGEFGIGSVPAHRRAGHYLGLRFSGGIPSDLPMRLAAADVYVSVRGHAMRVTPHVWNTDDDVEKLFAVLKAALS